MSVIMSSNSDHNVLRLRLRELLESYPEPAVLGECDCNSFSHFSLSIVLLSLGTFITLPTFWSPFNSLGQMWLIGPLCICCGIVVCLKSVLYMRKKSVLKMILRQRAIMLGIQELAEEQRYRETSAACNAGSTSTLPPPYELIQERLPTYSEAMKGQPVPVHQREPLVQKECCCSKKTQQKFDYSLSCILTHAVSNNPSILAEAVSLREPSTFIATSLAEISDFTISDNMF